MTEEPNLTPRPVRESQSEMAEIVLPNDANPLGALLGGRIMHWMDLAAAMSAHRHARASNAHAKQEMQGMLDELS